MKIKISIAQINVEQSLPEATLKHGEAMNAGGLSYMRRSYPASTEIIV